MDRRQRVTFRFVIMISSVLMLMCTSSSDSDKDKDKEECTEQLVGLATCLPYVGNTAKSPTPDCCNGLRNVLKTNKKCLCVIVKDRNDPDLGLTINATLALGLPSVCHASANVSNCPALLRLAPNSPEAQIFYQFDHGSNSTATSTPSSPISSGKVNTTSSGMSAPKDGNGINKRWVNWEIIVGGGLLLWSFT